MRSFRHTRNVKSKLSQGDLLVRCCQYLRFTRALQLQLHVSIPCSTAGGVSQYLRLIRQRAVV